MHVPAGKLQGRDVFTKTTFSYMSGLKSTLNVWTFSQRAIGETCETGSSTRLS